MQYVRVNFVRSVHRFTGLCLFISLLNVIYLVWVASGAFSPLLPSADDFAGVFCNLIIYPLPIGCSLPLVVLWTIIELPAVAALVFGTALTSWAMLSLSLRIRWIIKRIEEQDVEALVQGVCFANRRGTRSDSMSAAYHPPRMTILQDPRQNQERGLLTLEQIRRMHVRLCNLIRQVDGHFQQIMTVWIVIGWPIKILILNQLLLRETDLTVRWALAFYLARMLTFQGKRTSIHVMNNGVRVRYNSGVREGLGFFFAYIPYHHITRPRPPARCLMMGML